jgi:hypothetical protein
MENLTPQQQLLFDYYQSELSALNTSSKNKFTLAAAKGCIDDEQKFLDDIVDANIDFLNVAIKTFRSQIKEFTDEFGEAVTINDGYDNGSHSLSNVMELLLDNPKKNPEACYIMLIITPKNSGTASYIRDDFRLRIYGGIKCVPEVTTLTSGKMVTRYRYTGIWWGGISFPSHNNTWDLTSNSLMNFISNSPITQQAIIKIVNY